MSILKGLRVNQNEPMLVDHAEVRLNLLLLLLLLLLRGVEESGWPTLG
jgi:hypothetical protein